MKESLIAYKFHAAKMLGIIAIYLFCLSNAAAQNGAKAVITTLRSVADESTQILLSEFYRIRTENLKITKSAAIRPAQKELLNGKHSADEAVKKRAEIIDLSGKATK